LNYNNIGIYSSVEDALRVNKYSFSRIFYGEFENIKEIGKGGFST
ncbi:16308_t:CDS:1, partial [Cetraspora pellucida]